MLTKRPEPAWYYMVNRPTAEYLKRRYKGARAEISARRMKNLPIDLEWPLKNLWLGITTENQEWFDKRWQILEQIQAAGYFISHEPALGPIEYPDNFLSLGKRALVITGGEAGPGSRPMHPDWVRRDRAQCALPGVHFFFKQWGGWCPDDFSFVWSSGTTPKRCWIIPSGEIFDYSYPYQNPVQMMKVGKKKAGRLLDGREWNELPNLHI